MLLVYYAFSQERAVSYTLTFHQLPHFGTIVIKDLFTPKMLIRTPCPRKSMEKLNLGTLVEKSILHHAKNFLSLQTF